MAMNGKRRRLMVMAMAAMVSMGCSMRSKQYNSPIVSGGFGLSRGEWEQIYSKHVWEDDNQAAYVTEKWRFMVDYYYNNVGTVAITPIDKGPISVEIAREESKKLIPVDSKLVRTFKGENEFTVDLYYSESLKGRFPEEGNFWLGGEPGNFAVVYVKEYSRNNSLIDYFYINTGNRSER